MFESTIRLLGGLLAAYDLTKASVYLDKANDIGSRMLPAFNTPSGYPQVVHSFSYLISQASVNFHTGYATNPGWTGGKALLAEVGTVSIEYLYLAHATGNKNYKKKIDKVYSTLQSIPTWDGLLSTFMNAGSGRMEGGVFTMSGCADSYYEYLIKMWIQSGKKDEVKIVRMIHSLENQKNVCRCC